MVKTRAMTQAKANFEEKVDRRKKRVTFSDCDDDLWNFINLSTSRWGLDEFEVMEMLGAGGFGEVVKAKHKESGHIVALKKMEIKTYRDAQGCYKELNINASIQHPGVVRTYGHIIVRSTIPDRKKESIQLRGEESIICVCGDDSLSYSLSYGGGRNRPFWSYCDDSSSSSEDDSLSDDDDDFKAFVVYLILEYCPNGTLSSFMKTGSSVDEHKVSRYIAKIMAAITYLHGEGIMHRDIKYDNILISEGDEPKIADFGLSVKDQELRRSTFVGTPGYMAPELRLCSKPSDFYTEKVDLWSLGVLVYHLLVRQDPYSVGDGDYMRGWFPKTLPPLYFSNGVSKEGENFIRNLLKVDPKERLTIEDALNHPWITNLNSNKKEKQHTPT